MFDARQFKEEKFKEENLKFDALFANKDDQRMLKVMLTDALDLFIKGDFIRCAQMEERIHLLLNKYRYETVK